MMSKTELLPLVSPQCYSAMEAKATRQVEKYFPECLVEPRSIDVVELLERMRDGGKRVRIRKLPRGYHGRTWPNGDIDISEETYHGILDGNPFDRSTIPHELCHRAYHRHQVRRALENTGRLLLYRRSEIPRERDPEWQAECFASAFLMPRVPVLMLLSTYPADPVIAMSRTFQVSVEEAEDRYNAVVGLDLWRR